MRASGPWRVSPPGAREVTALNNQRQTNWTVDKAVQPPTQFMSKPFCPASQSIHPEPRLDGAAPAPVATSDPMVVVVVVKEVLVTAAADSTCRAL